jgi:hypothetical protein
MKADGTDQTRLINQEADDSEPMWQPWRTLLVSKSNPLTIYLVASTADQNYLMIPQFSIKFVKR